MTTLSIIKADVGSIGGHVAPSKELLDTVGRHIASGLDGLLSDYHLASTGDDIAILMVHDKGIGDEEIHRLAWDAFRAGTDTAQAQGLYGAGQDLLVNAFSGNVKGMGPAVAEMEFEARPNEPFLMFMADKTEPGAYNLPLYLAFADPMNTAGLLLSPELTKGFRFRPGR
jgi:fructose 1,6-bisphosphate aldolase/phosphatase